MITVNVKITDDITRELTSIEKKLAAYPQEAHDKFVELTPIRSGNARRHTQLKNNNRIEANYPYKERLDQGSSRQAPKGMTDPFLKWANAKIKSIFRK